MLKRRRVLFRVLFTLTAGVVLASLVAGCLPAKQMVLDPKVVKTTSVNYWVRSDAAGTAISPDGKYILLAQGGKEALTVAAVPLGAAEQKDVAFYSVSNATIQDNDLEYLPVGWLTNTQCVFISSGWQTQGPNTGKRGAAVMVGDTSKGTTNEVAFIPLEGSRRVHSGTYQTSSGKVYLDVTGAIWTVDVKTKTSRLVKGGLPSYDALFMARMSPDASAYVYQLHEGEGRNGIFMLDSVSGAEKPLAVNGDAMSFYPSWSPDGRYLAMYTVPKRPGATGTTWNSYEVYPGEDGPWSIAPTITVMDRSGSLVKSIVIDGKVLANLKWSWDSKSITFISAPKPASTPDTQVDWESPQITFDSLWSVNAVAKEAAPARLVDLNSAGFGMRSYIAPVTFDPESKGVLFQVSGEEGKSAVWYAASGKTPVQTEENKPVKVADGMGQYYPEVTQFGGSIAAIIGNATNPSALWLVSSKEIKKAGEWPASNTAVVGYTANMLVTQETTGGGQHTLTVRSMLTEK